MPPVHLLYQAHELLNLLVSIVWLICNQVSNRMGQEHSQSEQKKKNVTTMCIDMPRSLHESYPRTAADPGCQQRQRSMSPMRSHRSPPSPPRHDIFQGPGKAASTTLGTLLGVSCCRHVIGCAARPQTILHSRWSFWIGSGGGGARESPLYI